VGLGAWKGELVLSRFPDIRYQTDYFNLKNNSNKIKVGFVY
jgi:hypothetical protein